MLNYHTGWVEMGDTWRLVTWSKDQTLRYWRVDNEIQERCGPDHMLPVFQKDLFPTPNASAFCASGKKGSKRVSYTETIVESLTGVNRSNAIEECPLVQEQKYNKAILSEFEDLKSSKFQVIVANEDKTHLKVAITSNTKIKIR